ncbi:hypothetical protein DITRI_Ditri08aG0001600 [Diplodiscus trichospermus]
MKGVVSIIILVVGVCIGHISGVAPKASSPHHRDSSSATTKTVAAICSLTDFRQFCIDSLGAVANNESAVPKDYVLAAIHVTLQELQVAFKKYGSIFGNAVSDKIVKMAKDDCDDLLQCAINELQASFSMVGDSDLHNMQEREAEIKNWLNAVVSYQESCVDQVPHPQLKQQLSDGLLNATQLTSNALAIVNSISEILTAFGLTSLNLFGGGKSNRTLLDDKIYPSWVSSPNRKLLGSQNNAQLTPNAVVAKNGSGLYKPLVMHLKHTQRTYKEDTLSM